MENSESNLTFDLVRTVQVIQFDENLKAMFIKKFPMNDFSSILEAAKKGDLDQAPIDYAEAIYNKIILSRESLKELYSRNITSNVPILTVETPKQTKPVKVKVKLMPKEYNKDRILEDIKEHGGKATEFEKAMLALNEMKNLRSRLNNKGKRQRFINGKPFTDAECREIIAVVAIMKNRLDKIK